MRDKKLTQRMWDVLTQWIGDTIVVDEYTIRIRRGSRNTTVIWVSIVFRGTQDAQIGLESKDIGTFRVPTHIADILRKAFELKVGGIIYLNSNPCAEINCNSINGYHPATSASSRYDEHFIPPDDAIVPSGPW
jgi:hypothetical protein